MMLRGYKTKPLNETFILKIGIKIYTQSKTVVYFLGHEKMIVGFP
jgi:hypothetical protein